MNETGDTKEYEPKAWGFWATTGFTLIIIFFFFLAEFVAVIGFYATAEIFYPGSHINLSENDGLLLGISTFVGAPVTIFLAMLFAKLRRNISIKEYFCFFRPKKNQYLKWILAVLALAFCSDVITTIIEKPIVPDVMLEAYKTAGIKSLFWFVLVIVAPVTEEIIFRGFMFKGIEESPAGPTGAVIITSIGWAALHIQYDWYGISTIFAGGLLLGIARFKTKNIFIPTMMHSVVNFIATFEAAVYAGILQA